MRLSAAAKVTLDRAATLAAERSHKSVRPAHVLLAMLDDGEGILAISRAQLARRRLRDALVSELGASSSGSPYRSSEPVAPSGGALASELARAVPLTKRFGVVETTAIDLRAHVLQSSELASIVAAARFDPDPIEAFSRGAHVVARHYRSATVLVEHALLHAFEIDEVRAPLVRAGFDVDDLATKLAAHAEWSSSSESVVAAHALLEFATLKANIADAAVLSLEPILSELLRRDVTRKTMAAAGIDAHDVFLGIVHGARTHADPAGPVKGEVVFYDDPLTTMNHVVLVLREDLELGEHDAREAMLAVHERGSSAIPVGARDARAVARAVRARSKAAGMPLRVELVPA